jgi:hypothetical protein
MPVHKRAGAVNSPEMANILSEGFGHPHLSVVA